MKEDVFIEQEDDEPNEQFVVGLDIGYGNVKMSYGFAAGEKSPEEVNLTPKVFPATFQEYAPGEDPLYSGNGLEKFVRYKERNYLVFSPESSKLPNFTSARCTTPKYYKSKQYMILFLGALLEIGRKEIDLLVIGLPVSQADNQEMVNDIKNLLTGTFRPTSKKEVTVKRVEVIRQPIGAYFNAVANRSIAASDSTLFFDIGFFTTDWVLMMNRTIKKTASGSANFAVSSIIRKAAFSLGHERGTTVAMTILEDAIREGKYVIEAPNGDKIDFAETFKQCAADVVNDAMSEIYGQVMDYIVLVKNIVIVGGGASYFEEAIMDNFPDKNVILAKDSVTANASGFYWYGSIQAAKSK